MDKEFANSVLNELVKRGNTPEEIHSKMGALDANQQQEFISQAATKLGMSEKPPESSIGQKAGSLALGASEVVNPLGWITTPLREAERKIRNYGRTFDGPTVETAKPGGGVDIQPANPVKDDDLLIPDESARGLLKAISPELEKKVADKWYQGGNLLGLVATLLGPAAMKKGGDVTRRLGKGVSEKVVDLPQSQLNKAFDAKRAGVIEEVKNFRKEANDMGITQGVHTNEGFLKQAGEIRKSAGKELEGLYAKADEISPRAITREEMTRVVDDVLSKEGNRGMAKSTAKSVKELILKPSETQAVVGATEVPADLFKRGDAYYKRGPSKEVAGQQLVPGGTPGAVADPFSPFPQSEIPPGATQKKFTVPGKEERVFPDVKAITKPVTTYDVPMEHGPYGSKPAPLTNTEAWRFIGQLDDLARTYERAAPTAYGTSPDMLRSVAEAMRRELSKKVAAANPELAAQIRDASRKYNVASNAEFDFFRQWSPSVNQTINIPTGKLTKAAEKYWPGTVVRSATGTGLQKAGGLAARVGEFTEKAPVLGISKLVSDEAAKKLKEKR